jgi:hypothetical protein
MPSKLLPQAERKFTNVAFFLLAFIIRYEQATLYEIGQKGNVSAGSALAALRSLTMPPALIQSFWDGPTRQYRATKAGRAFLEDHWFAAVSTYPAEIEGVIRNAWIAWSKGATDHTIEYLKNAAGKRYEEEIRQERKLARESKGEQPWTPARMFGITRAAVRKAEGDALRKLGRELKADGHPR